MTILSKPNLDFLWKNMSFQKNKRRELKIIKISTLVNDIKRKKKYSSFVEMMNGCNY
jgi:hypothetical protein